MSITVPRPNALASTLFWFVGAMLLVLASSLVIYTTSAKPPSGAGLVPLMILWALAYLLGGYALRRQKWGFRWWAVGLCVSSIAGVFLFQTPMSLIILVLNVIALSLVALGWRKTEK